jgi:ribosomal protein L7/L12
MTLLAVAGAIAVVVLAWWVSQLGRGGPARDAGPLAASRLPGPPSELEVRSLLAAGDKIGAIKLYRELTGLGLKEAKDAVDAMEAGRSLPSPPTAARRAAGMDPATDPEIRSLVQSGQLIEAIKRYRTVTGAGLKEAKDAIEGLGR